jgi:two-component system sensor histidine kinase PilS (NtrC family)
MSPLQTQPSWLDTSWLDASTEPAEDSRELTRLWQGFMSARMLLGLVLLVLEVGLYVAGTSQSKTLVAISMAYLAGTVAARLFISPQPLGHSFNRAWGAVVGSDVLVFSALQWLQGGSVNFTPLFALPILLASVLGSLALALGTAATVTMLLLANTLWTYLLSPSDVTANFVQSALSGAGYFVIALLGNQLSHRVSSESDRARRSQQAARIQREVNALVIETLPDGVLVVDEQGCVRTANPAARALMGSPQALDVGVFDLKDEPGWLALLQLTKKSGATGQNYEEDVIIRHGEGGPRRVRARTRMAALHGAHGQSLCVLFLEDQRELEARMRTEKLASMGRLSTAVAHEIRNPLAAISQANALLDEDITDPRLKRLTLIVNQNAKRLEHMVDDILNVSRVQPIDQANALVALALGESLVRICHDWAAQSGCQNRLQVSPCAPSVAVRFDTEHLRRVLVNLLDNACRYATHQASAIQVSATVNGPLGATLCVWSNGAPMEQSVERHLFEPFFSSESRSSGLGLYICRELCEGHGATIVYRRTPRSMGQVDADGNEFAVTFQRTGPFSQAISGEMNETLWQPFLH